MTVATTLHLRRPAVWVIAVSLVGIAWLTLTPETPAARTPHYCLICGSFGTLDALLNVLLFAPLGVGLAMTGSSAKRSVLAMCALSVAIELAQLAIPGRDSTIGDVVFNTLGGGLGYLLFHFRGPLLKPAPRTATRLAAIAGGLWLLAQIAFAFSLRVTLSDRDYYMQIAPVLGNFSVFRGSVTAAEIADTAIPDGLIRNTSEVRDRLLRGDPLRVTVTTRQLPGRIAPIMRIADAARQEIVLLGQQRSDLVFSERTGATVLRLRQPFFTLPQAFSAATASADSVTVVATHSRERVDLRSQARLQATANQIAVRASMAWTVFLPFQWLIAGTPGEQVLGFLWTGVLLIPLGFWVGRANPGVLGTGHGRLWIVGFAAVILIPGLALLPKWLGIAAAGPADWLAALLAMGGSAGVGAVTTRRQISGNTR